MSFSFKSVYRLVSPAAQIGVKQFTLCLKGAHPGTGEFGAGASLHYRIASVHSIDRASLGRARRTGHARQVSSTCR
jgi:hypothetical protein